MTMILKRFILQLIAAAVWIVGFHSSALGQGYERRNAPQALAHARTDTGSVIEDILNRGLMKVGVSMFEPWVMCDSRGDLIGYEIDVARRIATDMGVRVQFVRTDWYFIIAALIEHEFDVIISGMSITPERNLLVNFTSPYSESGTSIVANSAVAESKGLRTMQDFNSSGTTIGAQRGTTPAEAVESQFPNAALRVFGTGPEVLGALLVGEVDAAATDQVTATKWIGENPSTLSRPFDQLFNRLPEAMAMRKGDVDGLNFFNSWIARYGVNGWLAERRRYWFESRAWADQVATSAEIVSQCGKSFEANPY